MRLLPRLLNLYLAVKKNQNKLKNPCFPCSKEGMDWLSVGIFVCINSHQHQFYAAVEGPLFVTEMD